MPTSDIIDVSGTTPVWPEWKIFHLKISEDLGEKTASVHSNPHKDLEIYWEILQGAGSSRSSEIFKDLRHID
jgi:hypothetical protein